MSPEPLRRLLIAALLAALAAPAWGYIVVLKDGTQIITKEKYRIEGEQAYMLLQSGVETFMDAAEIDVARTDEMNEKTAAKVRVLEDSNTVVVDDPVVEYQPERLSDLTSVKLSMPEPEATEPDQQVRQLPLTEAGFVNLWDLKREVHEDSELTGELGRYLKSQGVENPRIFKGSADGRVLLDLRTNTEQALFKALRDAATVLVQTQARFPQKLAALELVMSTQRGLRAGQFVLTKELADSFLGGGIDQQTFFYRFVQF